MPHAQPTAGRHEIPMNEQEKNEQSMQKNDEEGRNFVCKFMLQVNQAAIDFSVKALQSLFLINGAAATAILAAKITALYTSAFAFALGALVSCVAFGLAYRLNLAIAGNARDEALVRLGLMDYGKYLPGRDEKKARDPRLRWWCTVCFYAALVCFVVGLIAAWYALPGAPAPAATAAMPPATQGTAISNLGLGIIAGIISGVVTGLFTGLVVAKYSLFVSYKAGIMELLWLGFKEATTADNKPTIKFECREPLFMLLLHMRNQGHLKAAKEVEKIWMAMADIAGQWETIGAPRTPPECVG